MTPDTAKLLALCDEVARCKEDVFKRLPQGIGGPLCDAQRYDDYAAVDRLIAAVRAESTARQVTPTREQIMGIVCLSKSTDEAIDRIIALTAGRVEG